MRRIILNRKYIVKLATRWTTGIFAFLGLIGTFGTIYKGWPEWINQK